MSNQITVENVSPSPEVREDLAEKIDGSWSIPVFCSTVLAAHARGETRAIAVERARLIAASINEGASHEWAEALSA